MDEIRAQFETNFFGPVRVTKQVIPIMRKQRSGKIVNITSIGGRISIPLSAFYHGTKFALEGLSESIENKLLAKVILDAVTSDDPQLRYLVGKDAATIMEARKNMSDREFENLMKKQFGISTNTNLA